MSVPLAVAQLLEEDSADVVRLVILFGLLPRLFSALDFDLLNLNQSVGVLLDCHRLAHLALLILLARHDDVSAGHLRTLLGRTGYMGNLALPALGNCGGFAKLDVVDQSHDLLALW